MNKPEIERYQKNGFELVEYDSETEMWYKNNSAFPVGSKFGSNCDVIFEDGEMLQDIFVYLGTDNNFVMVIHEVKLFKHIESTGSILLREKTKTKKE